MLLPPRAVKQGARKVLQLERHDKIDVCGPSPSHVVVEAQGGGADDHGLGARPRPGNAVQRFDLRGRETQSTCSHVGSRCSS